MQTVGLAQSLVSSATASFAAAAGGGSSSAGTTEFASLLKDQIGDINKQVANSQAAMDQLLSGNLDNVHNVVLEATKTELTFRMLLEVRNRLTEQYQELMRMQV